MLPVQVSAFLADCVQAPLFTVFIVQIWHTCDTILKRPCFAKSGQKKAHIADIV